jgi:hypothetical protein
MLPTELGLREDATISGLLVADQDWPWTVIFYLHFPVAGLLAVLSSSSTPWCSLLHPVLLTALWWFLASKQVPASSHGNPQQDGSLCRQMGGLWVQGQSAHGAIGRYCNPCKCGSWGGGVSQVRPLLASALETCHITYGALRVLVYCMVLVGALKSPFS